MKLRNKKLYNYYVEVFKGGLCAQELSFAFKDTLEATCLPSDNKIVIVDTLIKYLNIYKGDILEASRLPDD